MDLNILDTIKKNYIKIMPSSTPHQKLFFYHLPTRGQAGIKLGDAWYISKVSIIFLLVHAIILSILDVLYAYMLFYMIFGTNLLT